VVKEKVIPLDGVCPSSKCD